MFRGISTSEYRGPIGPVCFYLLFGKRYLITDSRGFATVGIISDMVDRRRFLAGLGALTVGSGALYQSGAFSEVAADRGIAVNTAPDDQALLGLVDTSGSAQVSGPSDTTTVYEVTDNIGSLSVSDIGASVARLLKQDGTQITSPPVEATVQNTGGSQFAVDVSCTGNSDALGESYQVVLDIAASTDTTSVTATRTTSSYVGISCTYDYGDSSNYRDDDGGGATQPTNPSGDIENPSAVNSDDDNTATAISAGGNTDLKVGYSLPPVDETAGAYEIVFDIERIKVGNGSFGFYLVNSAGQEIASRQVLSTGTNTYTFTNAEENAISANYDDLYLIIDSETNGKGNRELELDYFELQAV